MNNRKARQKKQRCIDHRKERYQHAIGKVMDGKADPEYASLRWQKLKEVRQGS